MTKNWEDDLKLYLTSAGDRRRTIHFIQSLLTQAKTEARKEVVKEINNSKIKITSVDGKAVLVEINKDFLEDLAGKGK